MTSGEEATRLPRGVVLRQTLKLPADLEYRAGYGFTALSWSPDGKALASGFGDGTIHLWDMATGNITRTLKHGRLRNGGLAW